MRKSGMPDKWELVVCRITKIHPNSAFATLLEYDKTGMIHVSEVANRWVRNIREFLKENQYVVCRVMGTDREQISLSVKRVRREDTSRKLNEFKRERKAEKMLELAGKELKKTLDQAYDEAGYKMQDNFGSLSKAFDIAVKNPGLFKSKVPKDWGQALTELAKKSYTEKTYEVRASMRLVSYDPDGIGVIKDTIAKNLGKDVDIRYVSAPRYVLIGKGKSYKEVESQVETAARKITDGIKKHNGEADFELESK